MNQYSTAELIAVANQEMIKWLPNKGWKFVTGEHISRLGHCDSKRKEIMVSLNFNRYNDKRIMLDTILHEIAHALVYEWMWEDGITSKVHAHGWEWRRFAVKVGAVPQASVRCNNPVRDVKRESYKWLMVHVDGDKATPTEIRKSRFGKDLSRSYLPGNKRATLGKLYMVELAKWKKFIGGEIQSSTLPLHRSPKTVKFVDNLVVL